MDEVRRLGSMKDVELNQAKEVLAYEATKIVHGEKAAADARQAAKSAFAGASEGAEGIPSTNVTTQRLEAGILVVDLLAEVGLCKSKSDARRLVQGGGARVGERRIDDIKEKVTSSDLQDGSVLIRAGKKKVHRLISE